MKNIRINHLLYSMVIIQYLRKNILNVLEILILLKYLVIGQPD